MGTVIDSLTYRGVTYTNLAKTADLEKPRKCLARLGKELDQLKNKNENKLDTYFNDYAIVGVSAGDWNFFSEEDGGSGLWQKPNKGEKKTEEMIELSDYEAGSELDVSIDKGDVAIIKSVKPNSWADRNGLSKYVGWRVTGIRKWSTKKKAYSNIHASVTNHLHFYNAFESSWMSRSVIKKGDSFALVLEKPTLQQAMRAAFQLSGGNSRMHLPKGSDVQNVKVIKRAGEDFLRLAQDVNGRDEQGKKVKHPEGTIIVDMDASGVPLPAVSDLEIRDDQIIALSALKKKEPSYMKRSDFQPNLKVVRTTVNGESNGGIDFVFADESPDMKSVTLIVKKTKKRVARGLFGFFRANH